MGSGAINQKVLPRAQEQSRRSERVLLKIPIQVRGRGADGKKFTEKTFTLVINRDGARISLENSLRAGARITVTNLQNDVSVPFRVVGQMSKSLGEGTEWGVECLEPESQIWGISFPMKVGAPAPYDLVDALLECSSCHFRELAQLTLDQYRALIAESPLRRDCARCEGVTAWVFGFVEAEAKEAAADQSAPPIATPPPVPGAERRRAKRMTVKLPVRIRVLDGGEEVTRTENLSKTGVCFISNLVMGEGEQILLTLSYSAGSNEAEIPARVVWRRRLEGLAKAVYGVHLEDNPE